MKLKTAAARLKEWSSYSSEGEKEERENTDVKPQMERDGDESKWHEPIR